MAKRTTQQTLIWAGVVVGSGYLIWRWLFKDTLPELAPPEECTIADGIPVLDDDTAKIEADTIYIYMQNIGTEEEEIISILNNYNCCDLQSIWYQFGDRYYFLTGWVDNQPDWSTWIDQTQGTPLNLGDWMLAEFNDSRLEEIVPIFTGCTYQPIVDFLTKANARINS